VVPGGGEVLAATPGLAGARDGGARSGVSEDSQDASPSGGEDLTTPRNPLGTT